jgi:hypothetical protein
MGSDDGWAVAMERRKRWSAMARSHSGAAVDAGAGVRRLVELALVKDYGVLGLLALFCGGG